MYVNCRPLSFCYNISSSPSSTSTSSNNVIQHKKIVLLCLLLFLLCLPNNCTKGEEMSRRRTSNICRDHADCPRNAFCEKTPGISNGQCVCNHGFIIIAENGRRECYKAAATIGDSCVYHEQCMITLSTESECKYGRCECQNGTHYVELKNTCYKSVRVGEFCTFTNNCLGEGTVCRSGTCQCPYSKHPRFDGLDCIPDVHLGEKCSFDEECVDDNSRCNSECRCKLSHILSKDGDRCLQVSHYLHDVCEEDRQCSDIIPNSKCDEQNQTCVCKDGYHEINYKCWVSVPLGGICEVDENCASIDGTFCFEGHCICNNGLRAVGNVCSSSSIITCSQRIIALIFIINLFIYYYF